MSGDLLYGIPADIIKFLLVALFSLLIGLEQRGHYIKEAFDSRFGTDRTFTLIGILGFVLYVIDRNTLVPFLGGGFVVAGLLGVYYWQKIRYNKNFSITSLVTALITYSLTPLIYTQPDWLVLLIVVSVLVVTEMKETFFAFSQKFDNNEFITLAKFLVIAGVILPLLPNTPITDFIDITPYGFWLAVVAVSGISYLSYLLRKFVFPKSGTLLTGILGGLYSSTATTIILARKSKEQHERRYAAAVILATMMMYVRVFLLALFFNKQLAWSLAPAFALFIGASALIAVVFLRFRTKAGTPVAEESTATPRTNPLEFKTALLFAALFVFFALVTSYVNRSYGATGINLLSFIVGVTDIDPFILNLFQGKWNMENTFLVAAVVNAITSNNLLKMIYGITLSDKGIRLQLIVGFGILIVLGLLVSFVLHI